MYPEVEIMLQKVLRGVKAAALIVGLQVEKNAGFLLLNFNFSFFPSLRNC